MVQVIRPLPVQQLKLLVFDLDGTLIDSARDLCNSVNATLKRFDREPLPDMVVASYIGDGAVMLMRRALFGLEADIVLPPMAQPMMRVCWPRLTLSSSTIIASTSWTLRMHTPE